MVSTTPGLTDVSTVPQVLEGNADFADGEARAIRLPCLDFGDDVVLFRRETATNQISPSLVNGSLTLGFDGSVSLQVMEYVFDGPVAFTDDVEGDLNGVERIRS